MEKLKKHFGGMGFSADELEEIYNSFTLREFKKHDYFIEAGQISQLLGFIESGMFQYYVVKKGEIKTTFVSVENNFVVSLHSFASGTSSLEYVKALSDVEVYIISKADLKILIDKIGKFKDFNITLVESKICRISGRLHSLIVLSGDQRYEKMLNEEPHLLQQIPLQYLASMLGVTPRHLSRIRK